METFDPEEITFSVRRFLTISNKYKVLHMIHVSVIGKASKFTIGYALHISTS